MDIITQWPAIRKHFNRSFKTSFHVSIASVGADHHPTVTPIGSLFLNGDQTGFYFEKFPAKLPQHSSANKHICVLGVNSNTWFWLKSLFYAKFQTYPAIKLYGELGIKRPATAIEINRLNKRMQVTRWLEGNKYLWGNMQFVREIKFTAAEEVNLGKMTEGF